jgi:hypothetical protein
MSQPMDDNIASSRIPLKPSTHDRLREFRNGLKAESFDEAISLLLDIVVENDDEYMVGKRLRERLQETRKS